MEPRDFLGYRLTAVLGQGRWGVTYHATVRESGLQVALKIIPPDKLAAEGAKERLLAAVARWQALEHPGVLKVLAAHDYHGLVALAMELAPEGSTLDRLLFQGRIASGSPEAWDLALSLVQVFEHAQSMGVTHGGFAPTDVFVHQRWPGGLKVADFGLDPALSGSDGARDMPAVANVVALLLTGQPMVHGAASGPAAGVLERAAALTGGFPGFTEFHAALAAMAPGGGGGPVAGPTHGAEPTRGGGAGSGDASPPTPTAEASEVSEAVAATPGGGGDPPEPKGAGVGGPSSEAAGSTGAMSGPRQEAEPTTPRGGEPGPDGGRAGVAKPARARRRKPKAPQGDMPESLRAALRDDAGPKPRLVVARSKVEVADPFVEESEAKASGEEDWVKKALKKQPKKKVRPIRPAGEPKAAVPVIRDPAPRPLGVVVVVAVLLGVLGTGAFLAYLLGGAPGRAPEVLPGDERPSEQTEELALRRVVGIGTVPEEERAKAPVGIVPTPKEEVELPRPGVAVDAGVVVTPPSWVTGDTKPAAPVAPMEPPSPTGGVIHVPGGPEIPASPLTPQVGAVLVQPQAGQPPIPPRPVAPVAVAPAAPLPPATPSQRTGPAQRSGAPGVGLEEAKRLNARGLDLYREGRYQEAMAAYRSAMTADPSYDWPYYNLACMYALSGDVARAIQYLDRFEQVSTRGLDLRAKVRKDKDFSKILTDPTFQAWLEAR